MAKYLTKSGVIETGARNGKAFKIDGEWYSVYKVGQANGAEKGDSVSFEYETVTKGGQTFHNIQGNIKVEGSGKSSGGGGNGGGESRTSAASSAHGESAGGVSARDQQIIRQNALTQANTALATYYHGGAGDQGMAPEDYAEHVVDIARIFEKYSKGEV